LCKLAGGGNIAGCTVLLGNVKTAECLIFVALHERTASSWRFEATGIRGEEDLEKEPDTTRK
jgi:hypothetical protein